MGIIERLFGKKAALPNVLSGSSVMRMGLPVYDRYNQQQNVDRYATLDDIYSVVRLIAKTAAMVPIRVYKVKDEKKFRQYFYSSKQHSYTSRSLIEKMILKDQALEEVPHNDELQMLLDNPNPLYSKTEFLEGFYSMRLVCGNAYIYKPTLEDGVNAGRTSELWLMPTQYTNPVITQTFPKEITGYELRLFGIVPVPKQDVLHSRYFNPQFTIMGDELIGLSPLQPLHRTAQRSKSENDFMVRGFQNAGAQGIVNFEGLEEGSTEALGKMKDDFYRDAGGTMNARKSLFHAGKTTFTQIGLGPVDMEVIKSQTVTFKKICNAYGVSDILFNNGEASTESNVNEMIKRLYTNAALPEVFAYRDMLNQSLSKAYGNGYYIDADLTGITELQDDMKAMADIFAALPIMQPNLILEAFKYGKSEDPLMDKYYIKQGYSAIEDMQPVPDLINPAKDYNA